MVNLREDAKVSSDGRLKNACHFLWLDKFHVSVIIDISVELWL